MSTVIAPQAPQTLKEILETNNYIKASSHAVAYAIIGAQLPFTDGPIVSKKLFVDKPSNSIVYEFYRVHNKERKKYVIF